MICEGIKRIREINKKYLQKLAKFQTFLDMTSSET